MFFNKYGLNYPVYFTFNNVWGYNVLIFSWHKLYYIYKFYFDLLWFLFLYLLEFYKDDCKHHRYVKRRKQQGKKIGKVCHWHFQIRWVAQAISPASDHMFVWTQICGPCSETAQILKWRPDCNAIRTINFMHISSYFLSSMKRQRKTAISKRLLWNF